MLYINPCPGHRVKLAKAGGSRRWGRSRWIVRFTGKEETKNDRKKRASSGAGRSPSGTYKFESWSLQRLLDRIVIRHD